MKKRVPSHRPSAGAQEGLFQALASLKDASEIRAFLLDLCTPAELEALIDRWRVVPLIEDGMPYREIHDHTSVSVTTVGRVARALTAGCGGYHMALSRLGTLKSKRSSEATL